MYLGSIVIDDPGIYYEEGDEIIIEPSHELLNLEYRRLIIRSIKVTEPGEGFKEMKRLHQIKEELDLNFSTQNRMSQKRQRTKSF